MHAQMTTQLLAGLAAVSLSTVSFGAALRSELLPTFPEPAKTELLITSNFEAKSPAFNNNPIYQFSEDNIAALLASNDQAVSNTSSNLNVLDKDVFMSKPNELKAQASSDKSFGEKIASIYEEVKLYGTFAYVSAIASYVVVHAIKETWNERQQSKKASRKI